MGLPEFWEQMCHSPMLMVSTVLTLGVILVNGWTDAPNAIATCVSTRAISARKAIVMAAVFNFLGVLVMTAVNASVAMTIYNMVDFGGNAHISLVALCAAMAAIVIWATAAWYFGIPTSESHALIAGISGAAVAIQNSFSGINGAEWMKVIYGILLSTVSVSYTHLDVYKRQVGTVAINFVFTYPFLKFDFITPVNVISAIIMLAIAVITGMLTTKIKTYEEAKAKSEREKTRANLLRAVSHDLRTPLTSIYSASSLLRDEKETLTCLLYTSRCV